MELKFRAWDKQNNDWLKNVDESLMINPYTEGKYFRIDDMSHTGSDHVEIEQFTGLQDKNGVDIYVGDIVQYPGDYYGFHKQAVIYFEGRFAPLVQVEEGHNAIDGYEAEYFEVIGNIHQNPELLKK